MNPLDARLLAECQSAERAAAIAEQLVVAAEVAAGLAEQAAARAERRAELAIIAMGAAYTRYRDFLAGGEE